MIVKVRTNQKTTNGFRFFNQTSSDVVFRVRVLAVNALCMPSFTLIQVGSAGNTVLWKSRDISYNYVL